MDPQEVLTPDEKRVLTLLARDMTKGSIATLLHVSMRTVERLLGSIYSKLGVQGARGAIAQACLMGILTREDIPPRLGNAYELAYQHITPREIQVLGLVAEGYTPEGIASMLAISKSTVYVYLHTVLNKLHSETKEEAIRVARYLGKL